MHRPVLRLLAALLLTLVVLPLSAVAAHAATYQIKGRITGLDTAGKVIPLSGVFVSAHGSGAYPSPGGWTGADGTYLFHTETSGPFQVMAQCDARVAGDNCQDYAREWLGGYPTEGSAESPEVSVSDGVATVVDMQLDRLATVTGRVSDGTGGPVANVEVSSWGQGSNENVTATTDANGNYTLTRVDPFADEVLMSDPADVWQWAGVHAPIAPGPTVTTIDLVTKRLQDFTTAPTPTITGTAAVGSTLTADPGTWSPAPAAEDFLYTWYRVSSTGEEEWAGQDQTYTPTSQDVGFRMEVEVTPYMDGYRRTTRTSALTAPVEGLTAPTPTVTGTAAVGYTLTANPGAWGPAPVTLAYQWYRSGTAITGATASTYTLTSTDLGKTMTVKVTGSKTGYASVSRTSAGTSAVLNSFTAAPTPTISGTKAVGYTLTANRGTWSPTPDSFSYQWYRSGTAISGATASTYKLTSYDKGKAMTVRVIARKTGYVATARTSAATSAVLNVYSTTTAPTIGGTKKVGYTQTAYVGTWSPTPTSWKYQWYRGSTAISGAVYKTYKTTSYDKGKVLKVKVTPVLSGYYSAGKYSAGYTIY